MIKVISGQLNNDQNDISFDEDDEKERKITLDFQQKKQFKEDIKKAVAIDEKIELSRSQKNLMRFQEEEEIEEPEDVLPPQKKDINYRTDRLNSHNYINEGGEY